MDTFVTVLTVQYPQQLWIIKGRLESEGIQCFVKDELTVQAYNLYSNAVGGVKLQVLNEDAERAREILTELGYIQEDRVIVDLLTRIDAKTSFIPFLKNFNVVNRIVIMTLVFAILITTSVYLTVKPSLSHLLTNNIWTVDKIYYKNKLVGPKTTDSVQLRSGNRMSMSELGELAEFKDNNYVSLPGIQSREITGRWNFNDNYIVLDVDTLKNIFNGTYDLDIKDNHLILKSVSTTIYAHIGF
jgi:hypothetical protein